MYKISEFAKKIGVSVPTLRLWHSQEKLIPACITEGGQRLYSEAQVNQYLKRGSANLFSIGFMDGVHDELIKSYLCAKGSQFMVADNILKVIDLCHNKSVSEVVFYDKRGLYEQDDILSLIDSWGISIVFVDNTKGGFER